MGKGKYVGKINNIELSVIICTYNRINYLKRCINAILSNEIKNNIEIIIVDNNSNDGTHEYGLILERKYQNIHCIYEPVQGISNARNTGIKIAEGRIINFVDDDIIVNNSYLQSVERIFTNYDFDIVAGKVIPIFEYEKPTWYSELISGIIAKQDFGNKIKKLNKFPATCNIAFKKEIFAEIGLFNINLKRGEDKDIYLRSKKSRKKIYYNPDMLTTHMIGNERLSINHIKKQCFEIGQKENIILADKSIFVKRLKFAEYIFKIGVACFISVGYILLGRFSKAKYLMIVGINILKGYLN